MSALTIWQGVEERLRTVDGLQNVLLGEPQSVHELPAVYGAYEGFDRPMRNTAPSAAGVTAMNHRFTLRLVIQWADNAQAEMQLISLLDAIPNAIDADPKLSGRLYSGMAYINAGIAGFAKIGDAVYRVVDYELHALEKRGA